MFQHLSVSEMREPEKKKKSFRFIVECGTGYQQGGPLPDKSRRP